MGLSEVLKCPGCFSDLLKCKGGRAIELAFRDGEESASLEWNVENFETSVLNKKVIEFWSLNPTVDLEPQVAHISNSSQKSAS